MIKERSIDFVWLDLVDGFIESKRIVTIYLVNGEHLRGMITDFGNIIVRFIRSSTGDVNFIYINHIVRIEE